jgi:hypothetical protein
MTYIVTCRHHVAHKDCPWPECQQILALTEQLAKAKQAERLLNAQRKPKQSGMIKRVAKQEWVGLTNEDIKDIVGRNDSGGIGAYTREMFKQIEDKLREKNT